MGAVIMNLGQCAKDGVLQALKTMFKIEPSEPPRIEMQNISQAHMYAPVENYAALIVLEHKAVEGTGFIILQLRKDIGKKLLEKAGFKEISSEEVRDFCGEFCNIVAGSLKQEIQKLGLGLITIGLPKTYTEGVDEPIKGVSANHKYKISIFHDDQQLMTVEIAFSSLAR